LPPEFLLDRNLGTKIVPGLLRDAGWSVVTLADIYGEQAGQLTRDETWLAYAGEQGLAVLMLDKRIRYNPLEHQALVASRVNAFCLTSGSLTGQAQAEQFLAHERAIMRATAVQGPSLHMISRSGMRAIDLG